MKWFKHDSDASSDAKLTRLRMKYGLEGYGLYWYCLECVANKVDGNNFTFELEHDAEIIAFNTGIHYERVNEMMAYMVDLGLFEENQGVITCLKLAKRLDERWTKSKDLKAVIRGSADRLQRVGTRIEEKRREDIELPKKSKFIPPTFEQVVEYAESRGRGDLSKQFFEHFDVADWHDAFGNPVKSWKQKFITWQNKNPAPNQQKQFKEFPA